MKTFIIRLTSILFFLLLLIVLILYARGYKFDREKRNVVSTGILVASSYPDGAKVYINGQLKGATNTTVSLPAGVYTVEIKKDGYSSWSKPLTIKGEIVVKADALLFPQNPSLAPVTSLGIKRAFFSEKNNAAVLLADAGDPKKDGLYWLETSKKTLSLFNPLKLLALKSAFPTGLDFSVSDLIFSPDGKELILSFFIPNKRTKQPLLTASYLIPTTEETSEPFAITKSEALIQQSWIQLERQQMTKIMEAFQPELALIASDSIHIVSFAPDESKMLYQTKQALTLPLIITPGLIGANQTPEERRLEPDKLYVYDKKEDKNFRLAIENCPAVGGVENCLLWYSDSQHLVINEGKTIAMVNYDGENKHTVYSGPYEGDFMAVTTDGRILILANLNPQINTLPDLYAIGIR